MFAAIRRYYQGGWNPVVLAIAALCVLSAGVVTAGPGPGPAAKHVGNFLGFWEGVDELDGSPVRLSLSDVDNDGVLAHTLQEDFYSVCFNLGAGYSKGRGVETGTATVVAKDVMEVLSQLTCISDSNVPNPLGLSTQEYVLEAQGRNLVLPPHGSSPGIVLHHVAQ